MKKNLTNYFTSNGCWPSVRDLWTTGLKTSCVVLMAMMVSVGAYAQINLTSTPATCLQNGTLSWTAPAGAMVSFTVDDGMGNVINLAATSLSGLVAGTYTVTPFIDGVAGVAETATIADDFVPLEVELSSYRICEEQIRVNVIQGNLATIEVISGPTLMGTVQAATGNNPEELIGVVPEGVYELRLTDDCNNKTTLEYTVTGLKIERIVLDIPCNAGANCGEITVDAFGDGNGFYPEERIFDFTYTVDGVTYPGGTGVSSDMIVVPVPCGQDYTVTVDVESICGSTFTRSLNVVADNKVLVTDRIDCNGCFTLRVDKSTGTESFDINGPNGLFYSGTLTEPCIPGVSGPSPAYIDYEICGTTAAVAGTYDIVLNAGSCCEEPFTVEVMENAFEYAATPRSFYHCSEKSSARLVWNETPQSVSIVSGPDAPLDLTNCVRTNQRTGNGDLHTSPLTPGSYTVDVIDNCGNLASFDFEVAAIEYPFIVGDPIIGCNKFDLVVNGDGGVLGGGFAVPYTLEYFNGTTWEEVGSFNGNGSTSGTFTNITETGEFRINRRFVYSGDLCGATCDEEAIYTFTYNNDGLDFTTLEGVQCSDGGSYTINASSIGEPDFDYEIFDAAGTSVGTGTAGSGQNFTFSGLAEGTYTVVASNECGSQIREIELVDLPPLMIEGEASYCAGSDATLSIGGFSFLDFAWSGPNGNSSTTSTLNISNVTAADAGTYTVMVTSAGNDCINSTLTFELNVEQPAMPAMVNCWDDFQFNTATCMWDNVGDPNTPVGCTNPNSANYDPAAVCDDGSCVACPSPNSASIYMLVNRSLVDCSGDDAEVCFVVDGTNSEEYDVTVIYTVDGVENTAVIPFDGSVSPTSKVTVTIANITEGTIVSLVSAYLIPNCPIDNFVVQSTDILNVSLNTPIGCTDPNAPNYDPNAICDDGSCEDDPCLGINPVTPTISVSSNALCEGEELTVCVTGEPNSEYGLTEDGDISPWIGAIFRTDANGSDCQNFPLLGPGSGTFNIVSYREGACVIRYESLGISESVTVNPAPDQPSAVNCWDNYELDFATCTWNNMGIENINSIQVGVSRDDPNCDGNGSFCFTVLSPQDPASFSPVTIDYVVAGQPTPTPVVVSGSDFFTQATTGPQAGLYYYKACGQSYSLAVQDEYILQSYTATDGICTQSDATFRFLSERFTRRPIEQMFTDVSEVTCGGDATVCFISGGSNSESYLVEFTYEVNGVPFNETIDGDLDQLPNDDRQKCVTLSNLTETTTINLISSVENITCPIFYDLTETITIDPNTQGCTDPTALNYNPAATCDDGSCENDPCVGLIAEFTAEGIDPTTCGDDGQFCFSYSSPAAPGTLGPVTVDYTTRPNLSNASIGTPGTTTIDQSNSSFDPATGLYTYTSCVAIPLSTLVSDNQRIRYIRTEDLSASINGCTVDYDGVDLNVFNFTGNRKVLNMFVDVDQVDCGGNAEVCFVSDGSNSESYMLDLIYEVNGVQMTGTIDGDLDQLPNDDRVKCYPITNITSTTTIALISSVRASSNQCPDLYNDVLTITVNAPAMPTAVNCWDNFQYDAASCTWTNSGVEPQMPTNLACGELAQLNPTSCMYEIVADPAAISGCTDPAASNYDPNATCDDGSCQTGSTGCTVYNSEDFENGWGIWQDGGSDCYLNYEPATGGNGSNWCVRTRDNSGIASSVYTSPQDFSCATDIVVDFMYLPESMEPGEDFYLEYSTDGGNTFTVAQQWASGVDFNNGTFYTESVNIWGSFSTQTVIRFRCDASGNYDFIYLDNISISLCGCNGGGGNPTTCTGEITTYDLIDPSGNMINAVTDGETLCGDAYATNWTRVRVNASGAHESMLITVSGPQGTVVKTENHETYDSDWIWADVAGTYTVTAQLYSEDHLGGDLCDEQTITFTIDDSACGSTGGGTGDCHELYNYEGFETSMGIWNDGGSDCYENYEPATGGNGSNWCIRLRDDTGSNASMFTDKLPYANVSEVKIDFMYLPESMEAGEDFMLEYSTNNGTVWHIAQSWVSGIDFNNNQFYSESVTITQNFNNHTRFRFRCDASGNYDKIYIDEVFVYTCGLSLDGEADNVVTSQVDGHEGTVGFAAGAVDMNETEVSVSEVADELSVFPNPVSEVLNIKGLNDSTYEVYNIAGNKVMQESKANRVDLRSLSEGAYLLRTDDGRVMRFIKI